MANRPDVMVIPGVVMEQAREQMKRTVCGNCQYRSDGFTSVCVNGESERAGDFVMKDDTCEKFTCRYKNTKL